MTTINSGPVWGALQRAAFYAVPRKSSSIRLQLAIYKMTLRRGRFPKARILMVVMFHLGI